jgi:DNA-binding NarL/FixJ family response regulator
VRRGMGNKKIASELGITEPTVKAGIQRLFRRFGAGNRAQLVAAALSLIPVTGEDLPA